MDAEYQVIIKPSGTVLVGGIYDWRVIARRLSDGRSVTKLTVTHWGAKRWARKQNLDHIFAKYVDGGRLSV